ncbi:MAG: gamma-glutamylcyclotransferase [Gammaproteobacteria bacterium]
MSREYLFVYGTLLSGTGRRSLDRVLRRHLRPLYRARVRGRLYQVGRYPAAVPTDNGREHVQGHVVELRQAQRWLKWLDRYEDHRPDDPERGEYRREIVRSRRLADGRPLDCWIYVYTARPKFAHRIRSGSYRPGRFSRRRASRRPRAPQC